MVRLKRAYEPPESSDGYRVLVERLWPRGLRKDDAQLDAWLKEIAPSTELRIWFGHEPSRLREFGVRFKRELRAKEAQEKLDELARRAKRETVTLVYAARDEQLSDAVILKKELERRLKRTAT